MLIKSLIRYFRAKLFNKIIAGINYCYKIIKFHNEPRNLHSHFYFKSNKFMHTI